jgi:hypothetical protein
MSGSDVDSDTERKLLDEDNAGKGESESVPTAQASKELTPGAKAKGWLKSAVKAVARLGSREPASLSPSEVRLLKRSRRRIANYEEAGLRERSEASSYAGPVAGSGSAAALPGTSGTAKDGSHLQASAGGRVAHPKSKTKSDANPPLSDRLKRVRSEEEESNAPKKQKATPKKSPGAKANPGPSTSGGGSSAQRPFSGMMSGANPDLCLAIVDGSDPDGKIPVEKWLIIERALLIKMSRGGSADVCSFRGAAWQKGVKVVVCENGATKAFLTGAISEMGEPWPGADLRVIPASNLPLRARVRMWIPPPEIPVEDVLNILAMQNRNLPIKDWKVLSSANDKKGKGRDFLFLVDDRSLDILKTPSGDQLKFGLTNVRARIEGDHDRQAQSGAN